MYNQTYENAHNSQEMRQTEERWETHTREARVQAGNNKALRIRWIKQTEITRELMQTQCMNRVRRGDTTSIQWRTAKLGFNITISHMQHSFKARVYTIAFLTPTGQSVLSLTHTYTHCMCLLNSIKTLILRCSCARKTKIMGSLR